MILGPGAPVPTLGASPHRPGRPAVYPLRLPASSVGGPVPCGGTISRAVDRRQRKLANEARVRARVFAHYGTECACCGAAEDLTIDHVNGDGVKHRAELGGYAGKGGVGFYYWLIRQGFPEGYQALCRPCNVSKGRGSRCRLHWEWDGVRRPWYPRRKPGSLFPARAGTGGVRGPLSNIPAYQNTT